MIITNWEASKSHARSSHFAIPICFSYFFSTNSFSLLSPLTPHFQIHSFSLLGHSLHHFFHFNTTPHLHFH
ncbi:hypothetical protein P8452_19811 [Trifolium repens]|nr:hypothetical protein P8452_19811 [Trifolium repens]